MAQVDEEPSPMTPTLLGRWQTRLLLLATAGSCITLPFALGWIGPQPSLVYARVLVYVALLGLLWDGLYTLLQKLRWDHDWPGVYQLMAGVAEAVLIVMLIRGIGLPGIRATEFNLQWFAIHYGCVWLGIYCTAQAGMRIWFPRWRFRGGRWL